MLLGLVLFCFGLLAIESWDLNCEQGVLGGGGGGGGGADPPNPSFLCLFVFVVP